MELFGSMLVLVLVSVARSVLLGARFPVLRPGIPVTMNAVRLGSSGIKHTSNS
jgi:hypothetical protein